jgi:hypothetical protein
MKPHQEVWYTYSNGYAHDGHDKFSYCGYQEGRGRERPLARPEVDFSKISQMSTRLDGGITGLIRDHATVAIDVRESRSKIRSSAVKGTV